MAAHMYSLVYDGKTKKVFRARKEHLLEEARNLFQIPPEMDVRLELCGERGSHLVESPDDIPNKGCTFRIVATEKPDDEKKLPRRFEPKPKLESTINPESSKVLEELDTNRKQGPRPSPRMGVKPVRTEEVNDDDSDSPLEEELEYSPKDPDVFEGATEVEVTKEGLRIYEPKKWMTVMDKEGKFVFYTVGRRTLPFRTYGKVILLAGATGAGKANIQVEPFKGCDRPDPTRSVGRLGLKFQRSFFGSGRVGPNS
ncbi:unnamed protein product [Darwinula stevensoni]|uniref:Uncharacterized protein n=1 Tax=Darwinula stevensoni TaxID=69355 RepID=A0A7R8X6N1_9CRUS|nr:unnamed protein product [Darwinula stevensoni]CAG0888348.1 unnamed protein product [Darwinula stevensoni]